MGQQIYPNVLLEIRKFIVNGKYRIALIIDVSVAGVSSRATLFDHVFVDEPSADSFARALTVIIQKSISVELIPGYSDTLEE